MSPNDAIGGYFGLEIGPKKTCLDHFENGQTFDTIRSALLALLPHLAPSGRKTTLWFPVFVCPSVHEVMPHLGDRIEICPYSISPNLEPLGLTPESGDLVYHYSVFGLNPPDDTPGLIVDNAHALFAPPVAGQHTVYSARKFIGLADGASLNSSVTVDPAPPRVIDAAANFLLLRPDQGPEAGYGAFKSWEETVFTGAVNGMSHLSQKLLRSSDFEEVRTRRRENCEILHDALGGSNQLGTQITRAFLDPGFVPFSYPYLIDDGTRLRSDLISQQIYTPTLWAELIEQTGLSAFERHLAQNCVHLPIDQRYGPKDMKRIVDAVT